MLPTAAMSNSVSFSHEDLGISTLGSTTNLVSSGTRVHDFNSLISPSHHQHQHQKPKKKRNLPGNPDPEAEVIALSPKTLLATNRFVCEICNKGFQRDQNLQLHRRGHNLPWKLKQRNNKDIKKKAYVCPEPSCVHHHPSRALGDLTGIKKHYCRKHGEKKWKCEKCSKIYAVQSDWKAHSKTCGTREYRCDCGTLFSRKDSFITHRAFCDALAEESARLSAQLFSTNSTPSLPPHQSFLLHYNPPQNVPSLFSNHHHNNLSAWITTTAAATITTQNPIKPESLFQQPPPPQPFTTTTTTTNKTVTGNSSATSASMSSHHLSATALLQKAATVGACQSGAMGYSHVSQLDSPYIATWQNSNDHHLTRDFLGLAHDDETNRNVSTTETSTNRVINGSVNVSMNVREMLNYTLGVGFHQQQFIKTRSNGSSFGFATPPADTTETTWSDC